MIYYLKCSGWGARYPGWGILPPGGEDTQGVGQDTPGYLHPRGQAAQGGKINCYTGTLCAIPSDQTDQGPGTLCAIPSDQTDQGPGTLCAVPSDQTDQVPGTLCAIPSAPFGRIILWQSHVIQIWAATWQNQENECAPSEDSDQPGHPPSLIRVFAVRMKKAWVLSYLLSAQWRLWSD